MNFAIHFDLTAEALEAVTSSLPAGGERRKGQVDMARAIADAIETDGHVVVQAGTGTGKSLAYLVPAVLSDRPTVVATATKALQDQLAGKDLPFLADHLDVPFRFAVLKGRSNYLCLQRLDELEADDRLDLDLDDTERDSGSIDSETLDELRGRLVEIGTDQLVRALADGFGEPEPQVGDPVYAAKITATEREIDWSQSAVAIHRRVRVGGAFTTWNGKRFKIHRTRLAAASDSGVVVSTAAGHLELLDVQPEGKPRMDAVSWANGARWSADQAFGS